jgi:hypothetical protein
MVLIYAGSIGRFPVGGHAWVEMQYLLGLRALGHEVFYLEDCGEGSWVYNWTTEEITNDLDYPTAYVLDCLQPLGFGERWIYRAGDRSVGLSLDEFQSVCAQADLLIVGNRALDFWRGEYDWPRRRIYIDRDPGFTQIHVANGDPDFVNITERCERLFTIGQRFGARDCAIPVLERPWIPTVIPISLSHWPVDDSPRTHFTTIMQWQSRQEVTYAGAVYGNKNKEFSKFQHLPQLTPQPFRIALTGALPEQLSQYGWEIDIGWRASQTPWSYQQFIQRSRAEFAVAKHGYVAMRGGWFSDRSVCYMASGRPVLVQDTGQSDWLPLGEGVITFRDLKEAVHGVEIINDDYERHCKMARKLAEQYFAADRVLPPLLDRAMD